MREAVIVGTARTPIGRMNGAFNGLNAMDLGGVAIAEALRRAGVDAAQVDQVVMGHVLQAGQGQNPARQAAHRAGIPMTVPAQTINKVCPSGMAATALADMLIRCGEADLVVAGGMESMSSAPYLLAKGRTGYRMGDAELLDAMIHDGLWDAFNAEHMGTGSDRSNAEYGIAREAQDEWAAQSHERAVAAWKEGRFDDEVVSVEVPQRKGDPVVVEQDEGMRPGLTAEKLAGLRPAFGSEGTITAANASQISDGGAALVLAAADRAAELGLTPLGRITAYGTVAGPDVSLHHQPGDAVRRAATKLRTPIVGRRGGQDPGGYDLYEINEAFASIAVYATNDLGVDAERVNVNGGAVALGHPIGCTGARITITLLSALRQRGGGTGAAALCGGGGQGDALIVEAL